ncbi:MAG: YidC/Oxa1 family insertase periplasmic-domain containing protein [Planctomycetota bacterium]|jgi:YidC/Oxa1 family membrane protein insertase
MDKRALFRALMWSLAAFFAWNIIATQIWGPPVPTEKQATTEPAGDSTSLAGDVTGHDPGTAPTGAATPRPAAPTLTARGAEGPRTFILGGVEYGEDSPYRMQIELTNVGASVVSVALADFAQEVGGEDRYRLVNAVEQPDGRQLTSLPVEKITVDGQQIPLRESMWNGSKVTTTNPPGEAVEFTLDLVDAEAEPILQLTRRYNLPSQPREHGRYDLEVAVSVANLDQVAHQVILTQDGPVGVHKADIRGDNRTASVGKRTADEVELESANFSAVAKKGTVPLHHVSGDSRVWWAAVDNKFFAWIMTPLTAEGREGPDYLAEVKAVDLDGSEQRPDAVTVRLISASRAIQPGGTATYPCVCYLGPKHRKIFNDTENNPDYVRRNYYLLISRMYTFCTFSWLAELMIGLLEAMHRVIPNYGIAVIILVLIVRVLLHPITKKGQVNMMKMQKEMGKLAPKMEELKKKYANDKARLNTEIQKLYQSEGINPAGQMLSCLPMALQMPIWVALYTSLNNNIAMRHEPFCLWIRDLTAPDALIPFGGEYHIPLLGTMMGPITSLNILPILWAVSMYVQQKLMPKPKQPQGRSSPQADQAAQMQKMMPIMSIFFALIFYNAPSGLTLYIMASTVFGTLEQWRIRQHIKEMEAAGGGEGATPKPRGPRGPLWLQRIRHQMAGQWRQLQKQTDDAQRLRSKK